MRTSLLSEFLDLLSPRVCTICERRLAADEPLICSQCMSELPVTPYCESPYDNWMARLFWGQFPVEKVSAWIFFRPHSVTSKMIYDLKYHGQSETGEGYNQSEQVARGISFETHLPIYNKVVRRKHFSQSQTHQTAMERRTNVEDAFMLVDAEKIKGKHLLIVDDVITTGATVISCAQELAKAEGVRISVLSIGLTKE